MDPFVKTPDPPGETRSKIRIGTSGFSYKDWKGPFYPDKFPDRDMLDYYAGSFSAVEINSTYYAIPRPENMEAMARKADGRLEFVVKANQDITHNREKMEHAITPFITALRPLRDRRILGCVLLQFPYSFHHNTENREYLSVLKDRFDEIPLVAEFRNRNWIRDELFEFLRSRGIGYCCVDEPALPGLPPPIAAATSPVGYVRFHGRNREKWWTHEKAEERYDYEYSKEELSEWLPKINALAALAIKLYIFFNNHPGGQAVRSARMMQSLIQDASSLTIDPAGRP